ncbi:MAG: ThuA domain-containing protein [Verrucomicrobia bacterium]|nr:ThuA domain-containing protein [Verrucomicrobiota bacterium]
MTLLKNHRTAFAAALLFVCLSGIAADSSKPITLSARGRVETPKGSGQYEIVNRTVEWDPKKTAIIICDMWDQHWCKGATERVAEMAPRMNDVIKEARRRGVFIIHCPSDTMKFYEGTPQRKRAQDAPKVKPPADVSKWKSLNLAKEGPLPIDDSDGGCDDQPQCKQGGPWKREIATLEVAPEDAITDNGEEVYNLLHQAAIDNVIIMGVHANMCVLGRPFSIRQMVSVGKNVLLMRDMTDTMYNSRKRPFVSHFAGTELVVEHIEKFWCPSITSADILGGQPFRFKDDKRPQITFLINEPEYHTAETLPEFAKKELAFRGFNCTFLHADASDTNAFSGIEAIKNADLLVVSVRRRTPPKEQLELIRQHLNAGKPSVGIRTASHAFDAKPPDDRHEAWSTFDVDVLGANYQGHYGKQPANQPAALLKTIAASTHPVLTGIPTDEFPVMSHLYKSRNPAPTVTLLMTGHVAGNETIEPVAWVNTSNHHRVFYTSLGSPEDFQLPAFRRLLLNGILWALDQPIPPP